MRNIFAAGLYLNARNGCTYHGFLLLARITRRVWSSARVSWWLTMLLHRFPAETPFETQMRRNQFDYLRIFRACPGVIGGAVCRFAF